MDIENILNDYEYNDYLIYIIGSACLIIVGYYCM